MTKIQNKDRTGGTSLWAIDQAELAEIEGGSALPTPIIPVAAAFVAGVVVGIWLGSK